jgi:7-cyano-7-deazaguanine synthase
VTRRKVRERANSPVVCVLLSGGIDSSACVHYFRDQGSVVHALNVDYGQKAARAERKSARSIAGYFGVEFHEVACKGIGTYGPGVVPNRNALLLSLAAMRLGRIGGIAAIGIHDGTAYGDCSGAFLRAYRRVVDLSSDGRTQLAAPFLTWNKADIIAYASSSNLPFHLTYSCELGTRAPCGKCLSCKDREVLSVD